MKIIIKYLQLATFFLVSISTVVSQTTHEKRIELPLRENYVDYQMAAFGHNGLMVYSRNKKKVKGFNTWKIWNYDSDLNQKDSTEIQIPIGHLLDENFNSESHLILFFRNRKSGKYIIYKIAVGSLSMESVTGILPKKMRLREMLLSKNKVFLSTVIKKQETLIIIDLNTDEKKIIPVTLKREKLEGIQVDEKTGNVFVFINFYNKGEHNLFVKVFNGIDMVQKLNLSKGHDKVLSSVSVSVLDDKTLIFNGTYSNRSTITSHGIYFAKVQGDQIEFSKFYSFTDFENFFKYLSDRKQKKIEKKQKKKEKKGKELVFNYLIASHDVIKVENDYLYLGEAFYRTYRSETYTTTDANGNMVTHTRSVFDGYQYTHAVVARFNEYGEKMWDQIFEMWPSYKPYVVKRFIHSSVNSDNTLNLLFANRNSIRYESVNFDGEIEVARSADLIQTDNSNDDLRWTISEMEHWYGNNFIAFGSQKIKNKTDKYKARKRFVFFVNKISYNN